MACLSVSDNGWVPLFGVSTKEMGTISVSADSIQCSQQTSTNGDMSDFGHNPKYSGVGWASAETHTSSAVLDPVPAPGHVCPRQ